MNSPIIDKDVPFDAPGKHVGMLRLPHSVHRSAYGWLPIPAASIRNGEGPTVIVMAGNHGDEYEGQVIVGNLIRMLDPGMVSGQIILLPMANFPAAQAGMRTSPLDDGNLNRSFPGDPMGSPTAVLAHYIETVLFPRAQVVVDLHSGGSSLLYEGGNMLALEPRNDEEANRITGLLGAMGLPRALLHGPNPRTISSAARRQGAISIVTEIAGAGMITPRALKEAQHGVLHLLGHLGVLHGDLVPASAPNKPRFMRIDGERHYVYARCDGLFEPLVELGERVEAGQPAARMHFPENPLREPELIRFDGAGVVVCKRMPALSRYGDCLYQLAEEVSPPGHS